MPETQTEDETQTETAKAPVPHRITGEKRQPGSLLILSIEMPSDAVDSRVESVLTDFKKDAVIPGFRKGKAPMELVRRRLAKHARGEAVSRLIPDVVNQIMDERKIQSLAEPKLENLKSEEGAPVTFDVQFEVQPQIELPDLKDIEVKVHTHAVEDALVEDQVKRIHRANAALTMKDGSVAKGDAVTVSATVRDHQGQEIPQLALDENLIRTGDEDQMLPQEVIDALEGKSAGENFTVEVPRTIHIDDEQGHRHEQVTWTWSVTVKDVRSVTLPDLDDEFAKDVGDFDSLDDLRKKTRADLEAQEKSRQDDEAVGSALSAILDRTTFDAPASLVAQVQVRAMMRDGEYLRSMGMSFDDLKDERMNYWENTRADAEKRVRADLLLEAIGEQAKIEAADEDVDAEITRLAESQNRKPLAVRAQLEAKKQIDSLREQVRRRKIAEHLLSQVKVRREAAPPPDVAEDAGEKKPKRPRRKS